MSKKKQFFAFVFAIGFISLAFGDHFNQPISVYAESSSKKVISNEERQHISQSGAHGKYNANFLEQRYHYKPSQIIYGYQYPIVVIGANKHPTRAIEKTYIESPTPKKYDVVIIGGGPAGLTSAYYLINAGKAKSILLLEKESQLGGLAVGNQLTSNSAYARGGAYFARVEGVIAGIYKEIGMGDYKKKFAIEEPIDSYYWNGKLYINIWNEKTLARLPPDFSIFKYMLQKSDADGLIAEPPLDQDAATKKLDKYNFREWLDRLPAKLNHLAKDGDKEAQILLFQLQHDKRIDPNDPMKNVRSLLDLYGRSALGDHGEFINAATFLTFYYSELETRYAGNKGSAAVISNIISDLNKHDHFHAILDASVYHMKILKDHSIDITYVTQDKSYLVNAKYVVFSAPLFFANQFIDHLSSLDKEKYNAIKKLEYRDYQVTNLLLKGHPLLDTYDLWIRDDKTYSKNSFTDIIDGRWVDFKGNRIRNDDMGVLTIYHPLPKKTLNNRASVIKIAEKDADIAKKVIDNLNQLQKNNRKVDILVIQTYRWPYSMVIIKPDHYLYSAILERPVGNIYFANNNIGMPAIEDAVYRGWKAATRINQAISNE